MLIFRDRRQIIMDELITRLDQAIQMARNDQFEQALAALVAIRNDFDVMQVHHRSDRDMSSSD